MEAEGVIKYRLNLDQGAPPVFSIVTELAGTHELCFKRGYVGQEDSVHFGNISKRLPESPLNKQSNDSIWNVAFAITATQSSDLATGTLYAVGQSKPSSEAMTHMALYVAQPDLAAVIHGHSPLIWRFCLETFQYGTVELARVISSTVRRPSGFAVLEGHENGCLAWGTSPQEALAHYDAIRDLSEKPKVTPKTKEPGAVELAPEGNAPLAIAIVALSIGTALAALLLRR